jgi:hypothetical protein
VGEQGNRVAMISDLEAVEARLLQAVGKMIGSSAVETRIHFDIAVEAIRSDFNVVIDKTNALGENVDRLIERNGIEHTAFVEAIADHEVRLRVLEAMRQPDLPHSRPHA